MNRTAQSGDLLSNMDVFSICSSQEGCGCHSGLDRHTPVPTKHTNSFIKCTFYHLRNILRLWPLLSDSLRYSTMHHHPLGTQQWSPGHALICAKCCWPQGLSDTLHPYTLLQNLQSSDMWIHPTYQPQDLWGPSLQHGCPTLTADIHNAASQIKLLTHVVCQCYTWDQSVPPSPSRIVDLEVSF